MLVEGVRLLLLDFTVVCDAPGTQRIRPRGVKRPALQTVWLLVVGLSGSGQDRDIIPLRSSRLPDEAAGVHKPAG
jgi:hypothetical protein